mmetsp:Transcript_11574/g.27197  ORF Transcript_11574/g.27197 Transcript_11574/m.27197 type:complete len:96 (-) Transcript_11574:385-672(-)
MFSPLVIDITKEAGLQDLPSPGLTAKKMVSFLRRKVEKTSLDASLIFMVYNDVSFAREDIVLIPSLPPPRRNVTSFRKNFKDPMLCNIVNQDSKK